MNKTLDTLWRKSVSLAYWLIVFCILRQSNAIIDFWIIPICSRSFANCRRNIYIARLEIVWRILRRYKLCLSSFLMYKYKTTESRPEQYRLGFRKAPACRTAGIVPIYSFSFPSCWSSVWQWRCMLLHLFWMVHQTSIITGRTQSLTIFSNLMAYTRSEQVAQYNKLTHWLLNNKYPQHIYFFLWGFLLILFRKEITLDLYVTGPVRLHRRKDLGVGAPNQRGYHHRESPHPCPKGSRLNQYRRCQESALVIDNDLNSFINQWLWYLACHFKSRCKILKFIEG